MRPESAPFLRRHRPRPLVLSEPAPADLRVSDLILAVAGVALLGGFCLYLASGLAGAL